MVDPKGPSAAIPRWVSITIILVVVAMWCVSMVVDMAMSSYSPPPYIHGVLLGVAGVQGGAEFMKALAAGR